MSRDDLDRPLSTADLAGMGQPAPAQADRHALDAADALPREPQRHVHEPQQQQPQFLHDDPSALAPSAQQPQHQAEPLAALFPAGHAQEFRSRWDAVQIGFVDDPQRAVQQADELVAHVMKSLAESFAQQRAQIEADVRQAGHTATENQRIALQRYRSFFQRLLTL